MVIYPQGVFYVLLQHLNTFFHSHRSGSAAQTETCGDTGTVPRARTGFPMAPLTPISFSLSPKILSNVAIYLCAITVGTMSYYMADRKHRKAFLEARQSLEVKLNLEEQSQQQVGATAGQCGDRAGDSDGTPVWLWDMDKAPIACTLCGTEGPWWVAMGTGGPKVGNALAVLHPVPNLGTLRGTVLFQRLPAPTTATTKLSPSLSTATQQVPQAQPHGRSPSLCTATWQVPVPVHSHIAGP